MNPKINLEYIGGDDDECEVFFENEFLGFVPFWDSLEETQKISAVNDLIDMTSNAD
jgi:hypothetical protein